MLNIRKVALLLTMASPLCGGEAFSMDGQPNSFADAIKTAATKKAAAKKQPQPPSSRDLAKKTATKLSDSPPKSPPLQGDQGKPPQHTRAPSGAPDMMADLQNALQARSSGHGSLHSPGTPPKRRSGTPEGGVMLSPGKKASPPSQRRMTVGALSQPVDGLTTNPVAPQKQSPQVPVAPLGSGTKQRSSSDDAVPSKPMLPPPSHHARTVSMSGVLQLKPGDVAPNLLQLSVRQLPQVPMNGSPNAVPGLSGTARAEGNASGSPLLGSPQGSLQPQRSPGKKPPSPPMVSKGSPAKPEAPVPMQPEVMVETGRPDPSGEGTPHAANANALPASVGSFPNSSPGGATIRYKDLPELVRGAVRFGKSQQMDPDSELTLQEILSLSRVAGIRMNMFNDAERQAKDFFQQKGIKLPDQKVKQ